MRRGPVIILFLAIVLTAAACTSSTMFRSQVEKKYPPIGEFVDLPSGRLHVISKGEGAPVLMVHGASANAREFLITLVPELEDEALNLIIADRPGHGFSDRLAGSERLEAQAAAMADVLRQRASEPAIIVGHSFGGAVSLRLAIDHPELVKAVVLSAPVTHDWGGGGVVWYNQVASTPIVGPVFSQIAPLVGPNAARQSLTDLFSPAPAPADYADKMGVDLLFRPHVFRNNAKDVAGLQAQLAEQQTRYASDLKVPVISFSGSYDTVLKPKLHSARLKREAPDRVVLVKLDDEGHMPHHAKSALIADTILRLSRGESVQEQDFEL